VILGEGSYINDQNELEKYLSTMFVRPEIVNKKPETFNIIKKDPKGFELTSEPDPKEWSKKETFDYEEYAISGWFRWEDPEPDYKRTKCHLLFRLANNQKDTLKDVNIGDRALAAFYCNEIYVATYSIEQNPQPNLAKRIPIGEYSGLWTYIYFGYSNKLR
jgi:hypothetical protein